MNEEKLKEQRRQHNKNYYEKNKETLKKNMKDYQEKNKEWYQKYQKEYQKRYLKEKRKTDLKYKLSKNISSNVWYSLKGNKNGKHWEDIVGYTLNELINHLEKVSIFTIQDYLEQDLHIDHIIPQSLYSFKDYKNKEFLKCWNIRNLRIIEAEENRNKSDKLDMKLVEKYGIKDLIPNI